jgi:hypothetical protein
VDPWPPEERVQDLRPDDLCYVSFECALSEWGAISQIPLTWLTVATTGAPGEVKAGGFTIEFMHVEHSAAEILAGTVQVPGRPLRLASLETALKDLRHVGRNLNMLREVD